MKRWLFNIFFILHSSFFILHSQNLVPNPSFEDSISCPAWIGDMSVADWISPTLGSPDYFHTCNTTNAGVPQNVFGYQNARTGNAYVGGHTSDFSSSDVREYVQCQLISPLVAGKYYEVSFYVSRTDSSTKACDNIGAYLSATAISASNIQNLPYTPQVLSESNNPITNDTAWVQIIDTIIAIGGEQYLTMGIFTDDVNTNWISVNGGWESVAHYYIDDVSVVEVSPNLINEIAKTHVSVFPIPSNGFIYVNSNESIESYSVYTSSGQLVIDGSIENQDTPIDLSNCANGFYYIRLKTSAFSITKRLIINR